MEKLVLPYDMECMKIVMLKHEETFKQQVYELHRLYEIQRMLMKNMQRSIHNQETRSQKNSSICLEYQNDYTLSNARKQDPINGNGSLDIDDESEIELTLGPTSYTHKRSKTRKLNSDSMASFSSSSTSASHNISQVTHENSRVWRIEEQMRQVADRSLNCPSWLRQVLI